MKNALKRLSMMLLGLTFAFGLFEIALRVLGYSSPAFIRMDKERGWAPWPNKEGWTRNEGGKVYLRINSDGLRDIEHQMQKPANTLRIAVLGDSYTEAAQVPMEQAFWFVMGHQMSGCAFTNGRRIEVINLGVDGYGTDQELLTLREKAWSYAPDVIVLAFTPSNDVTDNSKTLSVDKDKPFFVLREGQLVMDTSFKDSTAYHIRESWPMQVYYRVMNVSRVLQLIRQMKNLWRQRKLAQIVQGTMDPQGGKLGLADRSYLAPRDATWEGAWRVTEALLQEMNTEVKAKAVPFLVVTVTRAIQVSPDAELRRRYMQRLGVKDLLYPEQRIATLAENSGFQVLTLAEPLQSYAEGHNQVIHFPEGHWNAKGNELAGQMIAERICGMLRRP